VFAPPGAPAYPLVLYHCPRGLERSQTLPALVRIPRFVNEIYGCCIERVVRVPERNKLTQSNLFPCLLWISISLLLLLLDGLYVLLRPPKKTKAGQAPALAPQAPAHLQHVVARDNAWPESCPWSLSGPQFPQPTAIQQRYCYPKGAHAYSSRVGGALWTMYVLAGFSPTWLHSQTTPVFTNSFSSLSICSPNTQVHAGQ
jgi:hypothetical protein